MKGRARCALYKGTAPYFCPRKQLNIRTIALHSAAWVTRIQEPQLACADKRTAAWVDTTDSSTVFQGVGLVRSVVRKEAVQEVRHSVFAAQYLRLSALGMLIAKRRDNRVQRRHPSGSWNSEMAPHMLHGAGTRRWAALQVVRMECASSMKERALDGELAMMRTWDDCSFRYPSVKEIADRTNGKSLGLLIRGDQRHVTMEWDHHEKKRRRLYGFSANHIWLCTRKHQRPE